MLDDFRYSHTKLFSNHLLHYGNTKQSLAHLVASLDVFISMTSAELSPINLEQFEMLQPDLGSAYLETLRLVARHDDIRVCTLAMQIFTNTTPFSLGHEHALAYLADVLRDSTKALTHNIEEDTRGEVARISLQLLEHSTLLSPSSPSTAQSALRARGGILSLLCMCSLPKLVSGLGRHISSWAQSLHLWLDEYCVSHHFMHSGQSLTKVNCRTFLLGLQRSLLWRPFSQQCQSFLIWGWKLSSFKYTMHCTTH